MNDCNKKRGKFFILFICAALCFGQWQQKEFIIAAINDPTCFFIQDSTGIPDTIHISQLKDYKDANFNLLTGMPAHKARTYIKNMYRLEVIKAVGGLKMLVDDWLIRISEKDKNKHNKKLDDVGDATEKYRNNLASDLKQYLYGYFVKDEPHFKKLTLSNWDGQSIRRVCETDPDRLAYVNLFSNRTSAFYNQISGYDSDAYKSYIDSALACGSKVISFDNYCYLKTAGGLYLRDKFFLNNQIVAEKAREHSVPFWAMILSVEHYRAKRRGSSGAYNEYDGPADYRTDLTKSQLRWQAYVPIIYGAKGIVWYTYAPLPNTDWINADHALVDRNLNKVDENHPYGQGKQGKPLYTWIKEINGTLKNMSGTIMNMKWIGTFHGQIVNNWKSIQAPWNGKTLAQDYFESNLPSLTHDSNSVIKNFGRSAPDTTLRTIAVGLFKDKKNIKYLMIMNKDIDADISDPVPSQRIYTINLKHRVPAVWKHIKTDIHWTKISGRTKSFSLILKPGDMELIALDTPPNAAVK